MVVLDYTSLMISGAEHIFRYLLAIYMSFFGKKKNVYLLPLPIFQFKV